MAFKVTPRLPELPPGYDGPEITRRYATARQARIGNVTAISRSLNGTAQFRSAHIGVADLVVFGDDIAYVDIAEGNNASPEVGPPPTMLPDRVCAEPGVAPSARIWPVPETLACLSNVLPLPKLALL